MTDPIAPSLDDFARLAQEAFDALPGPFKDAAGEVVTDGGGIPIRPSMFTGLDELALGASATWHLTETGYEIAALARRHLADGGTVSSIPDVVFPQPN